MTKSKRLTTMSNDKLSVDICCEIEGTDIDCDKLIDVAKFVCKRFNVNQAVIDIAIVDDSGIVKVNEQFLQSSSKTDVISFDLTDDNQPDKSFEIIINADRAARQAKTRGHDTASELSLYIVHGLLHNLGFDDCDDAQAEKMHNTEDQILNELGFGNVYYKD